ncbi:phospholipase [Microbacterium tenebrionis]|uniref:aggregation-promoting factor C-terminal-like domain-containing protein n=1 Tax=Microbacterium tenebrionis TaxID=2830665 RepID=UPI00202B9C97|nr:phospholipase [Microbacterium ihumii]
MPETRIVTRAHRRTARAHRRVVALTVVAGAALGLAATAGLTAAAPAAADVTGRAAVSDRGDLRAQLIEADAALESAQAALKTASDTAAGVEESGFDIDASIDTAGLEDAATALADEDAIGVVRSMLTDTTVAQAQMVAAQTTALQKRLDDAVAKKKAEEAAAAEAAAEAAAIAAANTPDGARDAAALIAADEYGWGAEQFSCLNSLWTKESGWNYQAYNPSGATGIPQALPGSKMASAGSDWQTNATTQIRWGLGYIKSVYGTPCAAWGHSQAVNWY